MSTAPVAAGDAPPGPLASTLPPRAVQLHELASARASLTSCIRGHEDALCDAVKAEDLDAADAALAAIDELTPARDALTAAVLDAHHIEEPLERLTKRRDFLAAQMQQLARQAVEMARQGNRQGALVLVKRRRNHETVIRNLEQVCGALRDSKLESELAALKVGALGVEHEFLAAMQQGARVLQKIRSDELQEQLTKRVDFQEGQMTQLEQKAVERISLGDKKGAVLLLKRKKEHETEIHKLRDMIRNLEQVCGALDDSELESELAAELTVLPAAAARAPASDLALVPAPPASSVPLADAGDTSLPPGWQAATSATGDAYYFNLATGVTQWAQPGPGTAMAPPPFAAATTPAAATSTTAAAPLPQAAAPALPSPRDIAWRELAFERDADGERVLLGRGSFASVYAAEYAHSHVAVKEVAAGSGQPIPAAALAALRREAALHAALCHDHVVRVHGLAVLGEPPTKAGLVMPRVFTDVGALLQRVAVQAASGGEAATSQLLPYSWRLRAVHELASGLAYLHASRMVHGDIKAGNVVVTPPERGASVALTDFGFSRAIVDGCASGGDDGGIPGVGAVRWMAPELLPCATASAAPAAARVTKRSDVFSWAIVAWQLLAAAPQPYAQLPADVAVADAVQAGTRPDVGACHASTPRALRELLARCWAADPQQRPVTGGVVLVALRVAAPLPTGREAAVVPVPPALLLGSGGGGNAVPAGSWGSLRSVTPPPPDAPAPASAHSAPLAQPPPPPPPALARAASLPTLASWRPSLTLAECPVCTESGTPGVALGCHASAPSSLPHALCMGCALRTVRSELQPHATCVRCPLCLAASPSVTAAVSSAAVYEVAAWSRLHGRVGATGDLRPLSDPELARSAAMQTAQAAAAAVAAAPTAAAPLPDGLFKQCPGCGTGIIRARGHTDHHISPGTGCLNCGVHFCFNCLGSYRGGSHICENGCHLFCSPECGCIDCTECAPGAPCDDCSNDGRCWVCQPDRRPPGWTRPVARLPLVRSPTSEAAAAASQPTAPCHAAAAAAASQATASRPAPLAGAASHPAAPAIAAYSRGPPDHTAVRDVTRLIQLDQPPLFGLNHVSLCASDAVISAELSSLRAALAGLAEATAQPGPPYFVPPGSGSDGGGTVEAGVLPTRREAAVSELESLVGMLKSAQAQLVRRVASGALSLPAYLDEVRAALRRDLALVRALQGTATISPPGHTAVAKAFVLARARVLGVELRDMSAAIAAGELAGSEAAPAAATADAASTVNLSVPPAAAVAALRSSMASVTLATAACVALRDSAARDAPACVAAGAPAAVAAALCAHMALPGMAVAACSALELLAGSSVGEAASVAAGAPAAVLAALRLHASSPMVAAHACRAVFSLAGTLEGKAASLSSGASSEVVAALRAHASSSEAAQAACQAISILAVSSEGAAVLVSAGAPVEVAAALRAHASSSGVAVTACRAVRNLADSSEGTAALLAAGAPAAVVAALRAHASSSHVVALACDALHKLAACSEGRAACVAAGASALEMR